MLASVNPTHASRIGGSFVPKSYPSPRIQLTISHTLMDYSIAVFPDRIQAEAAYTELEKAGFPTKQLTILGKGYKSADEFGLIDPSFQARKQSRLMAYWLIPFGFAGGFLFNTLTGLQTFPWAGVLGNQIIGGLLGAIGGAMGSIFVGGGVGAATAGDALPYRNRLNEGKYLTIVQGSTDEIRQASQILRQFEPESLQNYNYLA
jgi:hypothetical protein